MPHATIVDPIAAAAREGLAAGQKWLPPWLFYDARGSELFEQITALPEYYLTPTERLLLEQHADEIIRLSGTPGTVVELGAGTATKTGVLLGAAMRAHAGVLYQPIDISPTALDEASRSLEAGLPGLAIRPRVANYITEDYRVERNSDGPVLALYIGSSIGNFSPAEACGILSRLREQLRPGDHLLLGTDLAPGPGKPVGTLLAAYDDAQGVTAAFNRNILAHLNRELRADFRPEAFAHEARWNAARSRIEMHLVASAPQTVQLPEGPVRFAAGESIHTENSYKFTAESLAALFADSGFAATQTFRDRDALYALTLAQPLAGVR